MINYDDEGTHKYHYVRTKEDENLEKRKYLVWASPNDIHVKKVYCVIFRTMHREIPNYLSGSNNLTTYLEEPVKSKFTRSFLRRQTFLMFNFTDSCGFTPLDI